MLLVPRARIVYDSACAVRRAGADRSAATAPLQRRQRVPTVPSPAGFGGPRSARAGRVGRRMLAQAASADRIADGIDGGAR